MPCSQYPSNVGRAAAVVAVLGLSTPAVAAAGIAQRVADLAQFLRGADLLWVEKGSTGLRRWLAEVARSGRWVSEADLLDRAPDLSLWRDGSFAR